MCGGLVVLNPGSPTQVVCAILIMLFHLLLVLKTAPYVSDSEDWTAFASSLGLTLTYVGALLKMLKDRQRDEYDVNELNYADTAMNCLPIACVAIVVLIMIFVDCSVWKYMRGKKKKQNDGTNGNEPNGSLTQVLPIAGSGDEADQGNEKKQTETDNTKVDLNTTNYDDWSDSDTLNVAKIIHDEQVDEIYERKALARKQTAAHIHLEARLRAREQSHHTPNKTNGKEEMMRQEKEKKQKQLQMEKEKEKELLMLQEQEKIAKEKKLQKKKEEEKKKRKEAHVEKKKEKDAQVKDILLQRKNSTTRTRSKIKL